jgi:hypothetical protein
VTIRRIGWGLCALGAIGLLVNLPGFASGVLAASRGGQRLEGAWRITATVTSQPALPPLEILATFDPEGTLVGSAPNPLVSAAHGAWERTGNRRFALTAIYLRFDGTGTFLGTTKLRATFQGNQPGTGGSGQFVAQQFDPAGVAQGTDNGTAVATRIPVEPL